MILDVQYTCNLEKENNFTCSKLKAMRKEAKKETTKDVKRLDV